MCNLYHMTPKADIDRYFRARVVGDLVEGTVGPFGRGVFIHDRGEGAQAVVGQWGMIAPGAKAARPASRAILTNNARLESVAEKWTYRDAWRRGARCLIPADWYQEPNWETGKNIWWRLRRADGLPWALAGIWSEWTDPVTGELVPSYSMLTMNCDGHPLLGRLHKPDPKLPPDQQDKRAVIHIAPEDWQRWLRGDVSDALDLARLWPAEVFDHTDAQQTDLLLANSAATSAPVQGSLL